MAYNPEHEEYFRVTGYYQEDIGGPSSLIESPLLQRLNEQIDRVATLRKIFQRVSSDYFDLDARQYLHLQYSEQLANEINSCFLLQDECGDLGERIEFDLHHGYNHFRRVEKWVKEFFKVDYDLRMDDDVMYFVPAIYLGVRFHDVVEVYGSVKEKHDIASAWLSLGFLSQLRVPLPDEDWEKLTWGTAFLCRYHSHPEWMPDTDDLLENGLLQPEELYQEVLGLADKHDETVEQFYPPYSLIRNYTVLVSTEDSGNGGDQRIKQPEFTREEIEGLKRATLVFAAADKLDSAVPAPLSANRTFLTMPDRSYFTHMAFDDADEELLRIRHLCKDGKTLSDFHRFLYEITRVEPFLGFSTAVAAYTRWALLEKAEYLQLAVPAFLRGEFDPYLSVYTKLELETMRRLERQERKKGMRIDKSHVALLSYIERERTEVRNVLYRKRDELVSNVFPADLQDLERQSAKLLRAAVRYQRKNAYTWRMTIPLHPELPYETYYALRIGEYLLDQKDEIISLVGIR